MCTTRKDKVDADLLDFIEAKAGKTSDRAYPLDQTNRAQVQRLAPDPGVSLASQSLHE